MSLLTENMIKTECAIPGTFSRGKAMYERDAVFSLLMKKVSNSKVQMNGRVEGTQGDIYQTKVKLEKENSSDVFDYVKVSEESCTCKAFLQYNGYCKHLVATLLEINYSLETFEFHEFLETKAKGELLDVLTGEEVEDEEVYENNSILSKQEELDVYLGDLISNSLVKRGMPTNNTTASGRTFSYTEQTTEQESSKELLHAISGVVRQDRNRFCQEIAAGDVDLEVTLNLLIDEEKLELRIGKTQMYVVKNIQEFLNNIKHQRFVRYGQKLEFMHMEGAFSKAARDVIAILSEVSFQNTKSNYWYHSATDNRYLDLDAGMLEELLRLFEGKKLYVKTCFDYVKQLTKVSRNNPALAVQIKGYSNGKKAEVIFPELLILEGMHGFSVWKDHEIYLCTDEFQRDMKELIKLMAVNRLREERGQYHYFNALKEKEPFLLCEKDYAAFCSTLLPLLEKYTDVQVDGIDFSKYQIEDGEVELYFDLTVDQDVVCKAVAVYGEKVHNLMNIATIEESYRDIRMEYEVRTLLERYLPEKMMRTEEYLLKKDDDLLADLVEHGILQMKNLAEVYVSEAFKKIKIASSVKVETGVSIKGNLLNVSWNVDGMSKEELYDILSAYHKKRKYFRLKNGELLNLSDGGISIFAELQEDLHLSKSQLKSGMADIPVYRSLYLDLLMKENSENIKVTYNESFKELIDSFDEIKAKKYEIPKEIAATLRGYQVEGYCWVSALAKMGYGGILADDMGLGKTLQMITYLQSVKHGTHLVVCPASLVYNWEAEFQHFAPEMKICTVVGNAEEREELLEEWFQYDVLITSYDLLKRDIASYQGKLFHCQIIDEAQFIKNPTTQAAKAVKAIESRNRFALTGTPIENRLSELWSIFDYLMPGYLFRYKYFKENFEEKIIDGAVDEKAALERLHKMVSPFLLRRLKKDVLKDLPDKIEEVVYTKFDQEQDKLYKATEKNIVMNLEKKSKSEVKEDKLQILAELTKLRQICCDPRLLYDEFSGGSAKLDTCMEVLENAIEGGHRILLFSQFTTMLDIIAEKLKERKVSYFMLTGSTGKAKRRDLVDKFQQGRAEVFLISLKAGGTGLNLTAADMVIHYDPWWNVAAQNQATDRTHRIGQENKVTVVKLIAKNTIEERILKLQEKKKDLADKIITAEGISISSLSRDDLLELFQDNRG